MSEEKKLDRSSDLYFFFARLSLRDRLPKMGSGRERARVRASISRGRRRGGETDIFLVAEEALLRVYCARLAYGERVHL